MFPTDDDGYRDDIKDSPPDHKLAITPLLPDELGAADVIEASRGFGVGESSTSDPSWPTAVPVSNVHIKHCRIVLGRRVAILTDSQPKNVVLDVTRLGEMRRKQNAYQF